MSKLTLIRDKFLTLGFSTCCLCMIYWRKREREREREREQKIEGEEWKSQTILKQSHSNFSDASCLDVKITKQMHTLTRIMLLQRPSLKQHDDGERVHLLDHTIPTHTTKEKERKKKQCQEILIFFYLSTQIVRRRHLQVWKWAQNPRSVLIKPKHRSTSNVGHVKIMSIHERNSRGMESGCHHSLE